MVPEKGNAGQRRGSGEDQEGTGAEDGHLPGSRQEGKDGGLRLDEGGKDHRVRGRAKKEKKENEGKKDMFSSFTIMKG